MKLVFTGGHHSSAIPVIDIIKIRYPDWQIYWLGHKHSLKGDKNQTLEYIEISKRGIPFYELHTGKVYKVYNPFKLLKVLSGVVQAHKILKEIKPDLIVSFGGYLAVPVVLSGFFMHIPSITHEQTLVVGYANKVIGLFAKKILLSWESSKKYFSGKNTVYTGIPLRESIFQIKSDVFSTSNNLPYLLIMGGKSGSHKLNTIVSASLDILLKKYNIIHQCGDYSKFNDYDVALNKYNKIKDSYIGKYFFKKFISEDEIGEAYDKASLVISRSGAHTIAEILALKKKSLLIPISWVSHNEQEENAKYVEKQGYAKILSENAINPSSFTYAIDNTISELNNSNKNITNIINLDAATKIVDEIVSTLY